MLDSQNVTQNAYSRATSLWNLKNMSRNTGYNIKWLKFGVGLRLDTPTVNGDHTAEGNFWRVSTEFTSDVAIKEYFRFHILTVTGMKMAAFWVDAQYVLVWVHRNSGGDDRPDNGGGKNL
jgi:hypothetical protein